MSRPSTPPPHPLGEESERDANRGSLRRPELLGEWPDHRPSSIWLRIDFGNKVVLVEAAGRPLLQIPFTRWLEIAGHLR